MQDQADSNRSEDASREEIDDLVEVVKFDYEHTLGFISGVVRVSANMRTIATAGWFGLVAAAVQTGQAWLAILAAAAVAVLGLQDAYHGWLYGEARQRAHRMEGLLEAYYKYLQRYRVQPGAGTELLKGLHRHRVGQLSGIPDPSQREGLAARPDARERASKGLSRSLNGLRGRLEVLRTVGRDARPKFFYRYLYGSLLLGALAIALLLAATAKEDSSSRESHRALRVCIACSTELATGGKLAADSSQAEDGGHATRAPAKAR